MTLTQRLDEYNAVARAYDETRRALQSDMPVLFLGARKRAGLTQRQLAELLGVSFTYISKIEHGHMMPSDELLNCFRQIIDNLP